MVFAVEGNIYDQSWVFSFNPIWGWDRNVFSKNWVNSWLLMPWLLITPSHQQPWYLLTFPRILQTEHQKGFNSSPPGQNGCHFADIFKSIFMNEKFCILILISLKFVPKGLIDYKSALVQVMAWRWIGDKPLPETMMTQCTAAYMRH